MKNSAYYSNSFSTRLGSLNLGDHRKLIIGLILLVALIAFELFNFDTTQYALRSLLGDVRFLGIMWATILAVAFCAIDFAGLTRLFTPERGREEPREVWYLMGAWLLGATMNAVMTWWAVSLTLLNHPFGNEVLSREQLLRYVPIFVAVLVWLTRILFIGALTVTGEQFLGQQRSKKRKSSSNSSGSQTRTAVPKRAASQQRPMPRQSAPKRSAPVPKQSAPVPKQSTPVQRSAPMQSVSSPLPPPLEPAPMPQPKSRVSRIKQRPPIPNGGMQRPPSGVHARPKNQH